MSMVVTRKPAKKAEPAPVDVEALIRKGGSAAGEGGAGGGGARPGKAAPVVLRVPADVMERVDRAVQARRIKTPRHTWLLEAIIEKLDRERPDTN